MKTLFSVLLVLEIAHGITADVVLDNPSTSTGIFDPISELCCESNVYSQYSTFVRGSCCGGAHYDDMQYLCCNGIVTEVPHNHVWQYACCGNSFYNILTQKCCNNEVCDVPANCTSLYECCTGEDCGCLLYRVDRQKCCNNKVVNIPRDQWSLWECCPGDQRNHGVYNQITQQCCWINATHGVVRDYPSGSTLADWGFLDCCGTEIYDTRKGQICCNDRVVHSTSIHSQCCGSRSFNPHNQLCCDGDVETFHPEDGGDWRCCGCDSYDHFVSICCTDINGDHSIQPRLPGGNTRCCGTRSYNPNYQCCDEYLYSNVVNVPAEKPYFNCCNNQTYDALVESCCGGSIIEVSEEGCCGGNTFDIVNQVCCHNETVVDKPCHGHWLCCGDELYQPGYEYCCHDKVHRVEAGSNAPFTHACCDCELYDITSQICCGGRVIVDYSLTEGTSCCVDDHNNEIEPYNPHKDLCCFDRKENDRDVVDREWSKGVSRNTCCRFWET